MPTPNQVRCNADSIPIKRWDQPQQVAVCKSTFLNDTVLRCCLGNSTISWAIIHGRIVTDGFTAPIPDCNTVSSQDSPGIR